MKGKGIKDTTNYNGKKVYVEFSFWDITIDGSIEEAESRMDELREEYKDGI